MLRVRIADLSDRQLAQIIARRWVRGETVQIPKHLVEEVRAAIGRLELETSTVTVGHGITNTNRRDHSTTGV